MTTKTVKKTTTKPQAHKAPSARLFRAMWAAKQEAANLHADLTKEYGQDLSTSDLADALDNALGVTVRLDKTSDREEQHGDAQDLKDALEDAVAEANMLASEARAIEKRLERVLAQVRKHDTFKLPKGRK